MEASSPGAAAYDAWADYYDLMDRDLAPYVQFYRGLLSDRTHGVLELGCGTGTIALAIAQRWRQQDEGSLSRRIVGIDGSIRMLEIARSRDPSIEWLFGDIRTPPVRGPFDLIFCCFNTLQLLLEEDDLAKTFAAVHQLLAPEGRFAFDIYQPNIPYLSIAQNNRLAKSVVDDRGRHLEVREDTFYDPATRLLNISWRLLDQAKPDEPPLARTRYNLRQYFPAEIERLLSAAGLIAHERYGEFDRSAPTEHSRKQILICGRND
jgi:SAM-dependent methyltransferase